MKKLSNFLSENEEDKTEPRALKTDEGADDHEFFNLMSDYKQLRRTDSEKAGKILVKAQELAKSGDVSNNVQLSVAYL